MKNKKAIFTFVLICFILVITGGFITFYKHSMNIAVVETESASIKPVSSEISADGIITSENQATLHFQTGGKLIYLPFKEGDTISQGQIIAQLDTYALQRQLTQALNNYKVSRDTFDQTQQNSQNNVLQNQQKPVIINPQMDQGNAINDAVKRIIDTNQADLNNSVLAVELADYAQQLATLTSPLNGIVTHEDVTVPYQNVTPTTSFTVIDPSTMVFRSYVSDTDIDYVSEGATATIVLDGSQIPVNGTVTRIYPTKITLPNGQQGYQVDINSNAINQQSKLDQNGTALINSNTNQNVILVPAWTVLAGKYIWVEENNIPVLKTITTGKQHGELIEVVNGLTSHDNVITNPKIIPEKKYMLL